MAEGRTSRGQFQRGVSGNPGGRPKSDPAVKEVLKAASVEAAQELVALIHSGDPRVALAACREILDRVEGRPLQAQPASPGEGGPILFRWAGEGETDGAD